jgi:hypothetical protein
MNLRLTRRLGWRRPRKKLGNFTIQNTRRCVVVKGSGGIFRNGFEQVVFLGKQKLAGICRISIPLEAKISRFADPNRPIRESALKKRAFRTGFSNDVDQKLFPFAKYPSNRVCRKIAVR